MKWTDKCTLNFKKRNILQRGFRQIMFFAIIFVTNSKIMIKFFGVVANLTVVYALILVVNSQCSCSRADITKCHNFYVNQRKSVPTWSLWFTIFKARNPWPRALRVPVYSREYFHRTKIHRRWQKITNVCHPG